MKKWWSFVGALLLIMCGKCCEAYGEMCDHRIICDNPVECIDCGEAIDDDASVEILHAGYGYVNLGEQHQYQCLGCGEGRYDAEEHQVYCESQTECYRCGATDVSVKEDRISHLGPDWGFVNLGEQHQYQCIGCGAGIRDAEDHLAYCDVPTECIECGATGLIVEDDRIKHVGDLELVDIGDCHQSQCNVCGNKFGEPEKHWAMCDAPNHCNKCGLDDVTIDEDYLYHDGSKYVDVGSEHQEVCVSCNYAFESAVSHQGMCSEPNYCIICGLDGITIDEDSMWHDYFDELVCLDGQHQYQCTCGAEKLVEDCRAFCTDPLRCTVCDGVVQETSGDKQWHQDSVYEAQGEYCRQICYDCGYVGSFEIHFAPCNYGYRCVMCDTPVEEYTYHMESYYEDLGDKHQYKCLCGYSEPAEEHYGTCIEPTICYICEVEGLTGEGKHTGMFTDMGNQHHFECDRCSYTLNEQHWVICTDQSACYYCGKTGFEVTWENRYCFSGQYISFTDKDHTYYCTDCKETYTEPHAELEDEETCTCGYIKEVIVRLPGDASGDSTVNLADAVAILSGEVSREANADVNADSVVDGHDALLIMQYEAGWDVTLK